MTRKLASLAPAARALRHSAGEVTIHSVLETVAFVIGTCADAAAASTPGAVIAGIVHYDLAEHFSYSRYFIVIVLLALLHHAVRRYRLRHPR